MNILILSDLHHEFYRQHQKAIPDISLTEDVDVIVLLGDIDVAEEAAKWAVRQSELLNKPILLVPGNHEFYDRTIQTALSEMRDITRHSQVTLVDDGYIVIDDTVFVGGTLWTDMALSVENSDARAPLDFTAITVSEHDDLRPLEVKDVVRYHEHCLDTIERVLDNGFAGGVVVLSHHAPHPDSLGEKYSNGRAPNYASDLTWMMQDYTIDLWLHGHTHHDLDYYIANTRIAAHPRGYLGYDETPSYTGKIVSIDSKTLKQERGKSLPLQPPIPPPDGKQTSPGKVMSGPIKKAAEKNQQPSKRKGLVFI